jgi:hypothetical protein
VQIGNLNIRIRWSLMMLRSKNGDMLVQHLPLIAVMSTILCTLAFAADASEP